MVWAQEVGSVKQVIGSKLMSESLVASAHVSQAVTDTSSAVLSVPATVVSLLSKDRKSVV